MTRPQPHAGRTLLEVFWTELDEIFDRLMEEGKPDSDDYWGEDEDFESHRYGEDVQAWAETRGQAQGVAYCIAVMTNPYSPDFDRVRTEARERWQKRQEG